mgnify:FL=1
MHPEFASEMFRALLLLGAAARAECLSVSTRPQRTMVYLHPPVALRMAAPPDKPTDEPTLFAETSAAATSDAFQPSLSQGLLGMGLLLGASGLSGSLPKLIASASRGGPADALSSVALDLFVVLYSAYKLKLSFDKVDYDALPGRELRNSWAAEAATFASKLASVI